MRSTYSRRLLYPLDQQIFASKNKPLIENSLWYTSIYLSVGEATEALEKDQRINPDTIFADTINITLADKYFANKDYTKALDHLYAVRYPAGVRIGLDFDPQRKVMTIKDVIKNSPAEKNGIETGDRLLEVNS